jgi:HK97 family phage portal protein
VSYWLDATSWLVRHGNHYAYLQRGSTGPIRRLIPLPAGRVQPRQSEDFTATYHVQQAAGEAREYTASQIHHARGAARDGFLGDSPISDVREAIALEIAAERFGASFFGNGALPGIVFGYKDGFTGFATAEEREQFVADFQRKYGAGKRFRSLLLPKGLGIEQTLAVENDKAQFLETRKYQRTVIAGALGIPPHLVGDLERATFNNVEQQSIDLVTNAVLPVVRIFEASMERDLLTPEDRRSGVVIRFNLDGALRGDFATRQAGLKIQREAGVISPNDWRETENMNPISADDGGDTYWQEGPSGQGAQRGSTDEPTPP